MALCGPGPIADMPLTRPPRPASRRPRGRIEAGSLPPAIALCCGGRRQLVEHHASIREGDPGEVRRGCSMVARII
jgi:hypothetical protein